MIEAIASHKRWLSEQKSILPSTEFVALTRDCRRVELKAVAALKNSARVIGTALAKDAPKHPPEKVKRVRDVLKSLEAQIADFEARVGKFGAG